MHFFCIFCSVESGRGAPALRSPAAAKPAGQGDGGVIPTPSITSHSRVFSTELFLWKRCPRVDNGSGGQIIQRPSPPVLPMRLASPSMCCLLSSLAISIVSCRLRKRLRQVMEYFLNVKETLTTKQLMIVELIEYYYCTIAYS